VRIDVVAAIIRKGGKILITQRRNNVHLAGLWEFPGGKVEPGESLEVALEREIREELGLKIRINDEFLVIDHDYPSKSVRLHFFQCTTIEGEARPLDVADLRWVSPRDLTNYRFPPADLELIIKLQSEFGT
jgi:8-oxo-dGTP diphosphatase/A/G-specific adenine glycosylase